MPQRTTADLVAAAVSGDDAAWSVLVDRYERLVFSIARSFRLSASDAADVSQTVWLRFAEHLDRLHDPERAGSWLATTTRHECLRLVRSSGRLVVSDDLDDVFDTAEPVDAAVLRAERRAAVRAAFVRIPRHCQQLLAHLVADDRPDYRSVAAKMGKPVGWIGPTRGRCLEYLRREMRSLVDPDQVLGEA